MRQTMVVFGLAVVLLLIGVFTGASAEAVSCGDTLGPGGVVTLTSDVGPCSTDALTVVGPVIVDLAGHTISCSFPSLFGVVMTGKGAVLRNGGVKGCFQGVAAAGDSQIVNVVAQENNFGFFIQGARNTLDGNSAVSNTQGFFVIGASSSRFSGNIATGNTDTGFNVISATRSTFIGNAVFSSTNFGFQVSGSNNVLTGNTVAANPFGIFLSGSMNTLSLNTLVGNVTDAIDTTPDCDKNKWLRNVNRGDVPDVHPLS